MEYELDEFGRLDRKPWGKVSTYPESSILNLDEYSSIMGYLIPDFEKQFFGGRALRWATHHYNYALYACVVYLFFIYLGTKIMRDRRPFDLKKPLILWNGILAAFSFMGMFHLLPHLAIIIYEFGFEASICYPPVYTFGHGSVGLWTMFFVFSKYVELFDTVFIILRKKPLSFLHYYHHATVLLYSWDAYTREQPAGIYFVTMNYCVHTFMYFYYFLSAVLNRRLPWGIYVTMAQISQMFVGIGVTLVSLYYSRIYSYIDQWTPKMITKSNNSIINTRYREAMNIEDHNNIVIDDNYMNQYHYISSTNLFYACLMYSTYLYLFAQYFVQRYIKSKVMHKKAQ